LGEPFPIPDNGQTSYDLAVLESGVLDQVRVSLTIEHANVSDLHVTLQHVESGRSCLLFEFPACSGADINLLLDDNSPWQITDFCGDPEVRPVVSGSCRPAQPLSVFQGDNAAGTWRLILADSSSPDAGFLNDFCLLMRIQGEAPTPSQTPTPAPSFTLEPTATATETPEPTATPEPTLPPTEIPTETETPAPSPTSGPLEGENYTYAIRVDADPTGVVEINDFRDTRIYNDDQAPAGPDVFYVVIFPAGTYRLTSQIVQADFQYSCSGCGTYWFEGPTNFFLAVDSAEEGARRGGNL
jgi:subtilisin-like proprotein convertase family protein